LTSCPDADVSLAATVRHAASAAPGKECGQRAQREAKHVLEHERIDLSAEAEPAPQLAR